MTGKSGSSAGWLLMYSQQLRKSRPRITIRTAETSVSHVASGTSGEDESVDEAPVSWLEKGAL